MQRRHFIKQSGLLSAGFLLQQDVFTSGKKQKIGLQMYTLRHVINPKNVSAIFEKIAAIGYKELEIFGYTGREKFWGMEPKEFAALLKTNHLKAPSAHISFTNFLQGRDDNELRMTCQAAAIAGNKYIVVAWLDEQFRKTGDDYKVIAEKLNKAAIITGQFGLQLAYHNHDFEFTALEKETTGYDIILKQTDANLVKMELDLYWAVKAGKDPVTLFEENPGRFPLWHIKDMDKISRSFTEVGSGSIDFKKIFEHKKTAGLQHFFIEQDEVKKDMWESVKESFDYASKILI